MRMWTGVNPQVLCRQHLLGEHKELHMALGCMRKGMNITGYLERDLVVPGRIHTRHADVSQEMVERGYNHKTPMDLQECHRVSRPYREQARELHGFSLGDLPQRNLADLVARCPECAKRMKRFDREQVIGWAGEW